MVAALYVEPHGIYAGRSDVDPWDEARDARLYAGPWPVVGHSPCERWGAFAVSFYGRVGEDGGCFASCLSNVERWGGVLEHPAHSRAWCHEKAGTRSAPLPVPLSSGGWVRSMFRPGWACHVEQGWYGHKAPKPTWLYYVGDVPPPELRWGPAPLPLVQSCPSLGVTRGKTVQAMGKAERKATPPEFADVLLGLARMARGGGE